MGTYTGTAKKRIDTGVDNQRWDAAMAQAAGRATKVPDGDIKEKSQVTHHKFGLGTVITVRSDQKQVIKFDDHGEKLLIPGFVQLAPKPKAHRLH